MSGKEPKLLPCPFCGGPATLQRSCVGTLDAVFATCEVCNAATEKVTASLTYNATEKAAELWNRRAKG